MEIFVTAEKCQDISLTMYGRESMPESTETE
jgi:hypothetical protein